MKIFPKCAGAYLLWIDLHKTIHLKKYLKRFREITLSPGIYVYAGNAKGPGGLSARLARHTKTNKTIHWHIDAVTQNASIQNIILWPGGQECLFIAHLISHFDAIVPIKKFGSSDCSQCPSHFLQLSNILTAQHIFDHFLKKETYPTMTNPPFWKTMSLNHMTTEQWESLCDGCGLCCLEKLEDEENGDIFYTNIACRLLDTNSCRCANYPQRQRFVPSCIRLTPEKIKTIQWLPPTCAYRLIDEGKDLPSWHPLISQTDQSVHTAGISVQNRVIPESAVDNPEDHIISWPSWIYESKN